MRNTSNWTGRAPRSLSDAFGPYASLSESKSRTTDFWIAALAVLFCALVALGVC